MATLVDVAAHFLSSTKPYRLMISGRRATPVADKAEWLLVKALSGPTAFKPNTIIAGGADGVDSVGTIQKSTTPTHK